MMVTEHPGIIHDPQFFIIYLTMNPMCVFELKKDCTKQNGDLKSVMEFPFGFE